MVEFAAYLLGLVSLGYALFCYDKKTRFPDEGEPDLWHEGQMRQVYNMHLLPHHDDTPSTLKFKLQYPLLPSECITLEDASRLMIKGARMGMIVYTPPQPIPSFAELIGAKFVDGVWKPRPNYIAGCDPVEARISMMVGIPKELL